MFDIDGYMKDRQREEEIRCPYCDKLYDVFEMENELLFTLCGAECDEYLPVECPSCEEEFHVVERVRRTYEIYKRDCEKLV